ncbi:hypothetical protein ABIB40_000895 [Pedobacter sp. UYP30]
MKKLLILVMACYDLNARSQMNESKDFLYLYSDSTVYEKKLGCVLIFYALGRLE